MTWVENLGYHRLKSAGTWFSLAFSRSPASSSGLGCTCARRPFPWRLRYLRHSSSCTSEELGEAITSASPTRFSLFATLCALPLMHWRGAVNLKRWMVLVLIYQATTLLSVVNSPNRYDAVEWFHQILMVAGAAVVGWVTVERGRVRMALRGYILIAAVLSVWVIGLWFAHGFHTIASLPYGLQKNGLGVLFVIAVLAVHLAPSWIEFTDRWIRVLKYVCIVGVIATGSRQAMIRACSGCTYCNNSRSWIACIGGSVSHC